MCREAVTLSGFLLSPYRQCHGDLQPRCDSNLVLFIHMLFYAGDCDSALVVFIFMFIYQNDYATDLMLPFLHCFSLVNNVAPIKTL
jgi:hypothetical protein